MQGKIFLANFKYFQSSLLPFAVLLLACIPILGQLNTKYGYRPFAVGEEIKIFVDVEDDVSLSDISIHPRDGIEVLTPALRIMELGEVDWKVRALTQGIHEIVINVAGEAYTKDIVVATEAGRLPPRRLKSFLLNILYPGDNLLSKEARLESIRVSYPPGSVQILGHRFHWLVVFCVVSILAGLALKRVLKVEI
jgi:hypothetical protein